MSVKNNSKKSVHVVKDYALIAFEYAEKVVTEKKGTLYGEYERLACQRFLDDLERQKLATCAFYFDVDHANNACDFIEKLPHVKSHSGNIELHETQVFITCNLFGFRLKEDPSIRRFSTVYIEVARKNGKSTFAAGVALYCFLCEDEIGPDILFAATTQKQAKIVWAVVAEMIKKKPSLRHRFGLKVKAHQIECKFNGGTGIAISADGETNDGWNPHCSIVDELHAHKNRKIFDVIESADGARSNVLLMMITTAGSNLIGVCYDERNIVVRILKGVFKEELDHYFGIIFTLDKGDKPLDEKNWRKANPLLGVSVKLSALRKAAKGAKASIAKLANFETKRCNIWRHSSDVWLDVQKFIKCADADLMDNLAEHTANDGKVVIAVDLSEMHDMTSVTIEWIDKDGNLCCIPYHFLPEMTINNNEHNNYDQYQRWYNQGHLRKIAGGMIDLRVIKVFIIELCEGLNVMEGVFDRAIGALTTVAELEEELGIPYITVTKNVVNVSAASLDLESRIIAQKFKYDGCPILAWMASNVFITKGVNGTILAKKENKNSTNKIDGIDATIHGSARLMACPPPPPADDIGGMY